MFETLDIFTLARARASHAAARQAQVARNVANADTPGYRARDVAPFDEVFRATQAAGAAPARPRMIDAGGPESPNGNTVSLEAEMVRAVQAQRDHSRALTVYRSAMTVLRTSLGR
jgi:flagellar basal-body rod protein FlgB